MGLRGLPALAILDGGMGTELIARGLRIPAECPEAWNLERPDEVRAIHAAYFAAGADVVTTNTFGGHPARLSTFGRGADLRALNRAGVLLARAERPPGRLIAGSMGPSGLVSTRDGAVDPVALEEGFAEQAAILAESGVDLLHLETMVHPLEARCAMRGARRGAGGLPVVASICCRWADGTYETTLGWAVESMLEALVEEGASALGANCSLDARAMWGLVRVLRARTALPILAQPCGGPTFAVDARALFEAGADAVGGCCGVRPADIDALRRVVAPPTPAGR